MDKFYDSSVTDIEGSFPAVCHSLNHSGIDM